MKIQDEAQKLSTSLQHTQQQSYELEESSQKLVERDQNKMVQEIQHNPGNKNQVGKEHLVSDAECSRKKYSSSLKLGIQLGMEKFLGNRNWGQEKQEKKYWREIRKILDHQTDLDVKISFLSSHVLNLSATTVLSSPQKTSICEDNFPNPSVILIHFINFTTQLKRKKKKH